MARSARLSATRQNEATMQMNGQPKIPFLEYTQRLERLRALMLEKELRAVLLGTGMNLAYFSGYPSPSKSVPRPFFLLLPLEGDPVFFTQSGHRYEAVQFSWIRDVRDYAELSHAPVELIRDAMRQRGVLGKNVGMELGFEQSLDISYKEFLRLQEGLGETRLIDVSDILWRLRMIKSPSEIACIREACRITAQAYQRTFSGVRKGMLERKVYQTMRENLLQPGVGDVFLAITSGVGNYDFVTKPPEDRPIEHGDFVWMDAGCTIQGYWSDYSRAGVVGSPTAAQARAQEAVHRVTSDAVKLVRPGVTASALAEFCYKRLESIGFDVTSSIGRLAARIGHGVGLNITEPPHLGLHDDTPLEAGMVVTLEPGVATGYGTFHVEENVLVTSDGAEVLSECPRELWEISLA